jgi:cytochrome c oxidase subunit 2
MSKQMHIHPAEKRWITISLVMLGVFLTAVSVAAFALGIQVPSPETRVDPQTVAVDPNSPWSEPGVREIVPGEVYEVYILARTWQFQPRTIEVPAGAKVTFYVTSADVQHGFHLDGTNVNFQVLPGYVSKLSTAFKEPGTYRFVCNEYCGAGHAIMFGEVVVTP